MYTTAGYGIRIRDRVQIGKILHKASFIKRHKRINCTRGSSEGNISQLDKF